MMKFLRTILVLLLMLGLIASPPLQAGSLGKVIARSTMKRILRRDLVRYAATVAKPLAKPRTVFRYTSRVRAAREARLGLPRGTHMTSGARARRPLSAGAAQLRYGLPGKPEVRETVDIQDQNIRRNKVLGGEAGGFGEMTSPEKIPARAVRRIIPLR